MELRDVFSLLIQKFILIIIVVLIFMLSSAVITSLYIIPQYEAKSTLIVNKSSIKSNNSDYDYSDILLTQSLVNTYSIIIISDTVLTQVISNFNLDMSTDELRRHLIVSGVNDTEIISLKVTDCIPERAVDIANEITRICPEEIIRTANVGSVELIDPAVLPDKPVSPNITLSIIVAGFFGFVLILLYIIAKEHLDKTIKSSDDVQKLLGLSVLGQLPKF